MAKHWQYIAGALFVVFIAGILVREDCHRREKEELAATADKLTDSIAYFKGFVTAQDSDIARLIDQDSQRMAYIAELEISANRTARTVFVPVYEKVKSGGVADSILRQAVAKWRTRP